MHVMYHIGHMHMMHHIGHTHVMHHIEHTHVMHHIEHTHVMHYIVYACDASYNILNVLQLLYPSSTSCLFKLFLPLCFLFEKSHISNMLRNTVIK